MQISDKGLNLIKNFEGLRLKAYKDVVGILTIGYGSTGPHVKPDMVITEAQAQELLLKDLARFEKAVNTLVKVPLTQNQYDALVSFCFNIGIGRSMPHQEPTGFTGSTLLKLLNQGKYVEAAAQFLVWNKAGGKVVQGLTNRRQKERALFLTN